MYGHCGIDMESDSREHALRFCNDSAAIDGAGDSAGKLPSEKNVLGDVEMGNEREILKDHRNAEAPRIARRGDLHRPALVEERPGVGPIGPAQHLHEGRLARAVLAEQHVDLAGAYVERHVVERSYARKPL